MLKKFLVLFLLLFAVINAKVVILQSQDSNLPFAQDLALRLNELTEIKYFFAENESEFLQILNGNPDAKLLLILSARTAETYAQLSRGGQVLPPHLTILDAPIREEYAAILKRKGFLVIARTSQEIVEVDDAFIERIGALAVLAALQDAKSGNIPRFSNIVRIHLPSATPNFAGNERLIRANNLVLEQIDRIFAQLERKNLNNTDLWQMYVSTLGAIIDTAVSIENNAMIISRRSEIIEEINRFVGTPKFGFTALTIIVLSLFIFLYSQIINSYKRGLYKRRTALVIPARASKIPLVSDDAKGVPLNIFLDRDGFDMIRASTLKNFQNLIAVNYPDVLIADWERAADLIEFFKEEFANSQNSGQISIVLINIPVNKQTQAKKIFGGASVYCYETLPTLDDIQANLRGNKHISSYFEGSYFSGIIQEDNLSVILQMIEANLYTGCLIVEEDAPLSVIYFKNGRVVCAIDKSGESGIKSIYGALNCRHGNFYFHLNRTAQNENLNLGSIEILMGWAEHRDRFTQKIKAIND